MVFAAEWLISRLILLLMKEKHCTMTDKFELTGVDGY
jgi:hypothetical protein